LGKSLLVFLKFPLVFKINSMLEVFVAEIGLFFGSDEGNTEKVAYRIQQRLGNDVVDVCDIADVTQLDFAQYDKIILGIPTWDFGQIQSDWEEFWDDISAVDFSDKTLAFFGLGDQFGYGDYFLDAMGMLHDVVMQSGANIIGHWSCEGYEFDASKAEILGEHKFVGLALDEDQQENLTAERLNRWCAQIHAEFGLASPLHAMDD
jgi:flavodoxin I